MRIALVVPGCQVWHLLQLWDILVETEIGAAGSPSHRLSPLRDGFGRLLSSVVGSLVLLLQRFLPVFVWLWLVSFFLAAFPRPFAKLSDWLCLCLCLSVSLLLSVSRDSLARLVLLHG